MSLLDSSSPRSNFAKFLGSNEVLMVSKRRKAQDPNALRNIGVHPEFHALIHDEAYRTRLTLRERLHEILCQHYGRQDLSLEAQAQLLAR
jgi:hypothetical protein